MPKSITTVVVDEITYNVSELPDSVQLVVAAYELALEDKKTMQARYYALEAACTKLEEELVQRIRALAKPAPTL